MATRTLFTDRWGGEGRAPYDTLNLALHVDDDPAVVRTNRARAAEMIGVEQVAWMHQVHGDAVHVLTSPPDDAVGEPVADALVTALPDVALAVLVADCIPVLLADDEAGVVGAVHAGRRGVLNDVVVRAVDAMLDLGARTDRIEARLGPAVCGTCYEVPPDMQSEVATHVPRARATTRWGTTGLDLRTGLVERLEGRVGRVVVEGPCTYESPDHFSYRRDGRCGRTAGLVAWAP